MGKLLELGEWEARRVAVILVELLDVRDRELQSFRAAVTEEGVCEPGFGFLAFPDAAPATNVYLGLDLSLTVIGAPDAGQRALLAEASRRLGELAQELGLTPVERFSPEPRARLSALAGL